MNDTSTGFRWLDRATFRRYRWVLASTLVLLIAGSVALRRGGGSHLQYFTAKVERGDIRDVIEATGTVNPVITVQVGSQVSGTIASLSADFNSRVHQGEVIARIDPSLLQGALQQAVADSESAEAGLTAAKADLERTTASLVQAKADFDRNVSLAKDRAITDQQFELARATFDGARASVDGAAAVVLQARAQVSQKSAAVAVARTNLYHTVIRSPINGTVVARNVDVGQTVAASLQAPTIFTIAQDLTKMLVYTKVDESDVGQMKAGRPATFKVDAFPKDLFHGTVSQIRMNPTTIQNVVTYDVIIALANPDLKLFPGMTAYVTIPVATATGVSKVPNAALRYRPALSPDAIRALYRQYGIGGAVPSEAGRGIAMKAGSSSAADGASAFDNTTAVWKLRTDGGIEPVTIALGITDHAFTQVVAVTSGHLSEGDDVITGALGGSSASGPTQGVRR
ncbi:MAG: efflux RND transporter periplasmic adaptor subunit [Gemmatimonadales bacterium]